MSALDDLDDAIEKAKTRGLLPKGGALKLYGRAALTGRKRAANYILRRTANIEGRVKKK